MSEGEDRPPTRTHQLFHTAEVISEAWSDPAVDVAAVLALAWVAQSGASEATIQIIGGAIASVALGKRYIAGRGK